MFLKVQLPWNVVISPKNLDGKGLLLQRSIIVQLMEEFANRKATKDYGGGATRCCDQGFKAWCFYGLWACGECFLATKTMPDYDYVHGENPVFMSKELSKVEKGAKVRFMVVATQWVESERIFKIIGSLAVIISDLFLYRDSSNKKK
ncbi:hypothetical protein GIB67_027170 [Kingdonia uniflora]|uniref:Uncharacterized protein n=1 Tax=Kingdonia uniflora TaxID=39325 RepID=A0A7J7P211_9MAGN|nr:hypothetical protein GIB67_027170 [Kingdonia uniflora]